MIFSSETTPRIFRTNPAVISKVDEGFDIDSNMESKIGTTGIKTYRGRKLRS